MEMRELERLLPSCLEELDLPDLPPSVRLSRGKVRDVLDLGTELLITTTDRISAFDRVLTTIPCKGEVLNTLSSFWFRRTADIIANTVREELTARTVRAVKCRILPVEVVVRGFLTGSAWRDYENGRPVSGIRLPPRMRPAQRFDTPLLTPSTKEEKGLHDRPISSAEIVSSGIVGKALWERVEETARALFRRGSEVAAEHGLLLVDTKYEFGLCGGELLLADEVHTPDSSRFWYADSYPHLFASGQPQRELDKEYLRQWLLARGWKGDGTPPAIPDEVRIETARKYIAAWQTITGSTFVPRALDTAGESARAREAIRAAGR